MTSSTGALRGRREAALLAQPSVRRMADVLSARCRDASWVRTTVASLDRFATLTDNGNLEGLLVRARRNSHEAAAALDAFAFALRAHTRSQIAALALAPKLWFALNGVDVPWRPLPVGSSVPPIGGSVSSVDRLVLLALVGSGLHRAELLRLTLGDLGHLDASGTVVNDLDADPLAVRFVQQRGKRVFVTFFSDQARGAIGVDLARRAALGETLGPRSPLVAAASGERATRATVARAGRLNASLIDAGNSVNVELCRATGRFFRTWGLPGARFSERTAASEDRA